MTNLSFSEWLFIHGDNFWEGIRNISTLPTQNIKLKPIELEPIDDNPGEYGYDATFQVGNDKFEVKAREIYKNFYHKELENIFEISFKGPSGLRLTRKNSAAEAIKIYNHLLAVLVKMVEEERSKDREPNGFSFYPREEDMGLMYERLYKSYLQPAGYLRVYDTLYLRKDYIYEVISGMPSKSRAANQKEIYSLIIQSNRKVREKLAKQRAEKAVRRTAKSMMEKMVNSIVLFTEPADPRSRALSRALNATLTTDLMAANHPSGKPPRLGLVLSTFDNYEKTVAVIIDDSLRKHHNVNLENLFKIIPDKNMPHTGKLVVLGEPSREQAIQFLKTIKANPYGGGGLGRDDSYIDTLIAKYGGLNPQHSAANKNPYLAQSPQNIVQPQMAGAT